MNKKPTVSAALAAVLALGSGLALADPYGRHGYDRGYGGRPDDMGRVLDVIPVYEIVRHPVADRECWDEPRQVERSRSPVGTIAGGIIGGVVGNQFGQGSGKTALTIAGTALGAAIGNDASRDRYTGGGYDTHCQEVTRYDERREVVGYRVKYRYQGEVHWTRTDYEPGEYVPVDQPYRRGRW